MRRNAARRLSLARQRIRCDGDDACPSDGRLNWLIYVCIILTALACRHGESSDAQKGIASPRHNIDSVPILVVGNPIDDRHIPEIRAQLSKLDHSAQRQFVKADSLGRLAVEPYEQANYDTALVRYFGALALYEGLGIKPRIATTLTSIGNVYLRMDSNDEAGKVFERAYQLYRDLGDSLGMQIGLTDLGVYQQRTLHLEKAIEMYEESLLMARRFQNKPEEAIILGNIGSSYRSLGRYDLSLDFLKQALEIKQELGVGRNVAHSLNDLTQTYLEMGRYQDALTYAHQTIDYSRKYRYRDQLAFAYSQMSSIQEYLGRYPEALAYLYSFMDLQDSISNERKSAVINELNLRYQTSEREKAIAALAAQNETILSRRKLYFLVFILILIGAGALLYIQRLRRRRDRALLAKSKEVEHLRSQFFANISHEFRTPLTLILGPIHQLREHFIDQATARQLDGIERNARRLLFLINQILDLTRVDLNQLTLKVSEVHLQHLLDDTLLIFESLARERHINFTTSSSVPQKVLFGDPARLLTILLNLVSNAFKFTPDGGRITVRADVEAPGREHVLIEVSDSGTGIQQADLERVFDRYYSDDRNNTSRHDGVGIGLSLCKSLVELHGGTIRVRSAEHEGSTFSVRLPSGRAHFLNRADVVFAEHAPAFDGEPVQKKQQAEPDVAEEVAATDAPLVLIVEDRIDMRMFLKEILGQEYQILEATNGEEGLALAQQHVPDLIVSDVMMPVMDGIEFCKQIRSESGTSHIPVVLLTAKSSDGDRLEGLESEANAYLAKPFIPRELLLRLRNLLANRQRQQAYFARQSILKPHEVQVTSTEQQFFTSLSTLLETEHANPEFSVDDFASALHISRTQLHRKLKALTGNSASDVIRSYRLQRAYDLIRGKSGSVSEISFQVGFNSPSYFIKCFRQAYGKTPGEILENTANPS